jgi:hypothetical protein
MSRDESLPTSISLIDVLLVGFGLFLIGLSVSNFLDGQYLTAASDGAFGIAGLAIGLRQALERILNRDLSVMNQIAVVGATLGFILLAAELFV